jgi:arylsulfatase A-like enzyme
MNFLPAHKFLPFAALCLSMLSGLPLVLAEAERPPNIILIFADDLGYGDLACFGHPTIATPHLDRMAKEGQKWTNFYAAAPVCSPSRASLLTGRYPSQTGTSGSVFFEWSANGLGPEEVTIAEMLKDADYVTGMVGKWHLGHLPTYLPTSQGFDSYYGIPYSNDMRVDPKAKVADNVVFREGMTLEKMRTRGNKVDGWVPLMENEEVIEYPCDQDNLTTKYTERCVEFIKANKEQPFFLYYAQTFPHVPLYASDAFRDTSERGLYGDVVEEMDASFGAILDALKTNGLADNTLVVFTSDNGPWASKFEEGGSAGLRRGAKGQTWEGGMREPTLFWWPGMIPAGSISRELGTTMDLMATVASLTGATLPDCRDLDSHDLSGVLFGEGPGPRETFYFYRGDEIYAIRHGQWKAHFIIQGSFGQGVKRTVLETPLLYHLGHDPSEQYDKAGDRPEILEKMQQLKVAQEALLKPAPTRYDDYLEDQDIPDWALQRLKHK